MTAELARNLLFQMKRIRFVEETIAARYPEGKMRCPTHLSVGQEGVAAGVGVSLRKGDFAVSGHRSHAHFLAKCGDLPAMIAEIYGKATGCARGKGGSMHLIDESVGFMGSTAIVGGTVPVGVGLAYGIKLRRGTQVSCVFLGDAVAEAGVFLESLNFAVLKKLPVLFVCENNMYSVYSALSVRQPGGRKISDLAAAIGVPSFRGDGNDAEAVFEAASTALQDIRNGSGPRFLEMETYRWREHCGLFYDNDIGYRTEAEFLQWKARDPIANLEKRLIARDEISNTELQRMSDEIAREVANAFQFAETSPFPEPEEAGENVYSITDPVAGRAGQVDGSSCHR